MNRSLVALATFAVIFVGWLGFCWLGQPPSNQELLANYAKVADYFSGAANVKGWPWWTPFFMQGSSLASSLSTVVTNLVLITLGSVGGLLVGPKLAALFFLLLSPFTMYVFVRRLTGQEWQAFIAGVLYLTAPSLLLRMGYVEHISILSSMALLPLVFWGTLRYLDAPNYFNAVVTAICGALLTLTYAKVAVLTFPALLIFAVWAWVARASLRIPSLGTMAVCIGSYVLLAVLIHLPAIRETGFAARFEPAMLDGWQQAFASTSVITWLDFQGLLTSGTTTAPPGRDGEFLGLLPILILGLALIFRRSLFHEGRNGSICRLFLALALFCQWLSFGPYFALTAHVAFLKAAFEAPHISVTLAWLLLAFQVWLIFLLFPRDLPRRHWLAAIASLIYLFIPGFHFLEKLPLYGDIRAPHDVFQTCGIFCVTVATACVATALFSVISQRRALFILSIVAAGAILIVNTLSVTLDLRKSPLDAKLFPDFLEAQKFLSEHKVDGRVMPMSGRYFYLLTPMLSGRPLVTEAFNSFYMARGTAQLQQASYNSVSNLRTFLNTTGTSHLLLDKRDPQLPKELQDKYREFFPVVFENEHFAILENADYLAPAYLATDIATTDASDVATAIAALELAKYHIALIKSEEQVFSNRKPVAKVANGTIEFLDASSKEGKPFSKVAALEPRAAHYQKISLAGPAESGFLIVPESYHPDWTARSNQGPLKTYPAISGLLAVEVPAGLSQVTLTFDAPVWYDLCATASLISWLIAAGFLGGAFLLPARLKAPLFAYPVADAPPSTKAGERKPVQKPIIILPTYNEKLSVEKVLNLALAQSPAVQVLVVDDNSPDGTAEIVQRHPEFSRRVHLIQRAGKLGLGSAYKDGFQWALDRGYDACLEMDSDLSHDPVDVPRLIETLNEGYDLAIGSRYMKGIRVINWPEERLLLSTFASKYVRTVTRLPLTDATSGFKAIRAEALASLDWKKFRAEGYGFQIELHYYLWQNGWRIKEIPIVFTERSEGQTKMTPGIAIEAAWRVILLGLEGRREHSDT